MVARQSRFCGQSAKVGLGLRLATAVAMLYGLAGFRAVEMHQLSLRRVCLRLTVANTVIITCGMDSGWVLKRIAPSLFDQLQMQWAIGMRISLWELVAVAAAFLLLWLSVLACCAILTIAPCWRGRRLPAAARWGIWLSVVNLIVLILSIVATFAPELL